MTGDALEVRGGDTWPTAMMSLLDDVAGGSGRGDRSCDCPYFRDLHVSYHIFKMNILLMDRAGRFGERKAES